MTDLPATANGSSTLPQGVSLRWLSVARDFIVLAMALLSLAVSRKEYRRANRFEWGPIVEVAKLFAAIFVCLIPVTAMLHAGSLGSGCRAANR